MASFSSAIKIYCNKILPNRFDHDKDEPYFGSKVKINEKNKKNLDFKLVTKVASQLPVIVPPTDQHVTKKEKKLAAWTSVRQERWEGELVVEGELPLWLNGTYLRNGPGQWHIGNYNFRHLFDGYATLVRLHFENGRLIMGHRQVESEAYKAARSNNKICYREFSEVPKPDNFLAYIGDMAKLLSGSSLTDNANTGVVKLGDGRVVCLTETIKGSIVIDPNTLDTMGKFEYSDTLGGLIHSAHPIVTDSEFITLIPDLINPGYLVVRMDAGTNERKYIGRVSCRGGPAPGWVHSFPVTENYIIVPEMPLRYCAQNLLKAEPTPLYKFEWHPHSKAFMHVMCKASGNIVASVEVPLYVTFHFINGYEEKDEDGRVSAVIADCCEHSADTTILDKLRLDNLRSYAGKGDVLPDARTDDNTLQIDLFDKKAKNWYDDGAVPSEPFFVARPGATEEDEGVVISMISDKNGEGYALILDGSTFEEIARAKFPYGLPYGLHGCWVPKK
ncbi:Carotenoid cleavage dioxygenase 8, chloroplastic [Capsicum annuum]|nr:Carotenoid cleavage dioxygenase 8, chloroplastic [Capsicum annuum]KAF3627721.1 Carotenoid cleavage dioxygenase 8, chloroplastic [Capsicum annuum]